MNDDPDTLWNALYFKNHHILVSGAGTGNPHVPARAGTILM